MEIRVMLKLGLVKLGLWDLVDGCKDNFSKGNLTEEVYVRDVP